MKGGLNELALFSGAGGGLLASKLLGWNTIGAVEIEEYPRNVVLQRQRDGMLEPFPIWDDVCTFDGKPWRGSVDVVSGGFPCQDISAAWKGPGITGERSGLWKEYLRIVKECHPRFVFAENTANLRKRGLRVVINDLARVGYSVRWITLDSSWFGVPHPRPRMFILAVRNWKPVVHSCEWDWIEEDTAICPFCGIDYSECPCPGPHSKDDGWEISEQDWGVVAYPDSSRRKEQRRACPVSQEYAPFECSGWWETEPGLGRVVDELAHRVDRLKAIGNGQVPAVAATAFNILSKGIL